MKSLERSQTFINHTSKIAKFISNDSGFHLATEDEYTSLHKVFEEEMMELKKNVNIKYSRKPDLVGSFIESLQIPAIITDKKNLFLAVLSEMFITQCGEKKKIYYASDLRVSKRAGIKVRMKFRKTYVDLLRQLDHECYTVVLKDNQKAINALTKNKSDLFYHPVYEYTSRSILVLPTISLISNKLNGLRIIEGRDSVYEDVKIKSSAFAHFTSDNDKYFLIQKDGLTVGSFSLVRPVGRTLNIEAKSNYVRFWINMANKVFSHNYEEKLPWIYMTSFFLNEDIDKSECLKLMLKYLYKKKVILSGEIFLICHSTNHFSDLKVMAPVIKTNAILFRVTTKEKAPLPLSGPVYLNPLNL